MNGTPLVTDQTLRTIKAVGLVVGMILGLGAIIFGATKGQAMYDGIVKNQELIQADVATIRGDIKEMKRDQNVVLGELKTLDNGEHPTIKKMERRIDRIELKHEKP